MKTLRSFVIGAVATLALSGGALAGPQCGASGASANKNLVDTAVAAGSFATLAKAIQAAGLADTLTGAGPYTVFAPTDEAFAKLPAGALDELLKPENKAKLQAVLKYHVVSGDVRAADVTKLTSARTLEGASLSVSVSNGTAKVGPARVVKTDVVASNGVIHVIDTVLLPPAA
jgi:uncharacterized surface protein with fasciclin (FAS1) repeats